MIPIALNIALNTRPCFPVVCCVLIGSYELEVIQQAVVCCKEKLEPFGHFSNSAHCTISAVHYFIVQHHTGYI